MVLYEMLDKTLFYQKVWIYETNAYDQNMPLFKDSVNDARGETEKVWDFLMCEVEHYECDTGILFIQVKNKHFESRMEKHYLRSDKWGQEKEKRPWRYSGEIREEIAAVQKE